jgi:hypothetical protein
MGEKPSPLGEDFSRLSVRLLHFVIGRQVARRTGNYEMERTLMQFVLNEDRVLNLIERSQG